MKNWSKILYGFGELAVVFFSLWFSVYLTANFFHWVFNKLDSTLVGQERYYYCDDCSNPILSSCYNSDRKLEVLEWDLCQIKKHNWKYRKTIYESPEYVSRVNNTKVNINIF